MKRSLFGAVALAAVALSAVLIGGAAAKPPAPPTSSTGCPNGSLTNYPASGIVGAGFTSNATTSTYTFLSTSQNPTGGVPGLVGYCVYTNTAPTTDTATYDAWKASKPGKSFGFQRPGGESTNIPLDGNPYTVGNATWPTGTVPTTQEFLLHISGTAANVCNGQPTCWVRPGLALTGTLTVTKTVINDNGGALDEEDFSFIVNGTTTAFESDGSNDVTLPVGTYTVTEPTVDGYTPSFSGCTNISITSGGTATCAITNDDNAPICDTGTGNTGSAYNAIPTDVEDCSPGGLGFQANQVNEFGDEVELDLTAGTTLESMRVDFQSFACESGAWEQNSCQLLNAGATFHVPASGGDPAGIRANIYEVDDSGLVPVVGDLIATAVEDPAIPFRPSKDDTNCTGANAGKWFNAVAGVCSNSLSVPITFDEFTLVDPLYTFSPDQHVVWSVTFNTQSWGYNPIGSNGPWNSLNVGAKTYPGSPYAGHDVSATTAFWSRGGVNVQPPFFALSADTGWDAFRPLGEIVFGP